MPIESKSIFANVSPTRALLLVIWNLVLPLALLLILRHYVTELVALSCIALLPASTVIWGWVRQGQANILGLLVLFEIVVTILLAVAFGNARLILLKGPVQLGALGIACMVSLLTHHPLALLILQVMKKHGGSARLGGLQERLNDPVLQSRPLLRRLTLVWGVSLILDSAVRVALVFRLTVPQYLVVSPTMQWIFLGLLGLWSLGCARSYKAGQAPNSPRVDGQTGNG